MATFKLRANELTGETGLTLFLYPPGATVANGSGDALSESSGLFTATVAESLTGWHDYFIYQSGLSIYRGRVYCDGATWIADQADPALAAIPTAATIADAVWDELLSGHATSGSAGAAITAIKAKTDNLPSDPADASVVAGLISDLTDVVRQSNVATEVDSSTIKLNVASTKTKTHYVTGNLTGKTLKLYIETAPGVFFAERDATGADGSFSFTPSSALVANIRTFSAALREPSDGNNVLWKGSIEVAYAADAE